MAVLCGVSLALCIAVAGLYELVVGGVDAGGTLSDFSKRIRAAKAGAVRHRAHAGYEGGDDRVAANLQNEVEKRLNQVMMSTLGDSDAKAWEEAKRIEAQSKEEEQKCIARVGRGSGGGHEPVEHRDGFADFESRCKNERSQLVLVALPYNDDMPCVLKQRMFKALRGLECNNPGFNLEPALYDKPYENNMNANEARQSGRTVLAHIRNTVIKHFLKPHHHFVLWMDADVMSYPPNLIQQLNAANPAGISAPLVLIENTNEFYDRAAFMAVGHKISADPAFPGFFPAICTTQSNPVCHDYLNARTKSPAVIDCESVGTTYLIPAQAYHDNSVAANVSIGNDRQGKTHMATVEFPRPDHFPTAFTEHFPVIHYAKYALKMKVWRVLSCTLVVRPSLSRGFL